MVCWVLPLIQGVNLNVTSPTGVGSYEVPNPFA